MTVQEMCGGGSLVAAARFSTPADAVAMAQRSFGACSLGSGTSPGVWQTISTPPVAGSHGGDVGRFSLAFPCSEKRVHSGLYDGLTWPQNGYASLD
jgi:hypothetical protein